MTYNRQPQGSEWKHTGTQFDQGWKTLCPALQTKYIASTSQSHQMSSVSACAGNWSCLGFPQVLAAYFPLLIKSTDFITVGKLLKTPFLSVSLSMFGAAFFLQAAVTLGCFFWSFHQVLSVLISVWLTCSRPTISFCLPPSSDESI